jgi:hypothetical protein
VLLGLWLSVECIFGQIRRGLSNKTLIFVSSLF